MTGCYIDNICKNKDKLLAVFRIMAADSYFARRPFADRMVELGFTLVSRLQSNCVLKYYPTEQWLAQRGVKRGKKPKYAGKVDIANPDRQFFDPVQIDGAKSAWTGIVYSNGLKRSVRGVIVEWQKTVTVVFFSSDTEMEAAKLWRYTAAGSILSSAFGIAASSPGCIIRKPVLGAGWDSLSTSPFLHGMCCGPKLTDIFPIILSVNSKTPSRTRNLHSASLNMPSQTA